MIHRVCHISFNHDAYDDRIYWKELLSLKEKGYAVTHICVGNENADFTSPEGVRIIQVKKRRFFKNIWLNRFFQLIWFKRSTIYYVFKQAFQLKASIYHYHDLQLNALTKKLKKLPWKPHVIYDSHEAYHLLLQENNPNKGWKRLIYKEYIRRLSKWELRQASYCDHIISTDTYTFTYFTNHLPFIPQTIIYNYSYFLPAADAIVHPKKWDFIYTGLLSKGRGILEIIEAMAKVVLNYPHVKLLLIGPFEDDAFQQQVVKLIITQKLIDTIKLHPPVPFLQIATYYKDASVGLGLFHPTPKYTTFIPIKLFEYMAFGLPVIFANHGPSAAIIEKADCGLLVSPTDITAISQSMIKLMTNKQLYYSLSKNGVKAVQNEYNWNKEKEKLYHIYDTLLSTTSATQ